MAEFAEPKRMVEGDLLSAEQWNLLADAACRQVTGEDCFIDAMGTHIRRRITTPAGLKYGKLDAAWTGSSATVSIWTWNGSAWEDSGDNETAYMPPWVTTWSVASGAWLKLEYHAQSGQWHATKPILPSRTVIRGTLNSNFGSGLIGEMAGAEAVTMSVYQLTDPNLYPDWVDHSEDSGEDVRVYRPITMRGPTEVLPAGTWAEAELDENGTYYVTRWELQMLEIVKSVDIDDGAHTITIAGSQIYVTPGIQGEYVYTGDVC
jgi:hypothetical protein